jgi:4-hydroxy-2-oxoheptanedioate aldolase
LSGLADRLRAGETLYTAWCGWTAPGHAETLARSGFDAVTLDMQHGLHSIESAAAAVGAVRLAGRPALVRIPVGAFDAATRALDVGAEAVIAPMINSEADARAFAGAMKYPPVGGRSWGPERAMQLGGVGSGPDFLSQANASTLAIAMIETREALASLDAILGVDGIDGVFVGPSDFSIAWSGGDTVDATLADMMPAIEDIGRRTAAAGKVRAIFCTHPSLGARWRDYGYQFIAAGYDPAYVSRGAKAFLDEAKG